MRYIVLTYALVEQISGLLQLLGSMEKAQASFLQLLLGQGRIGPSLYWLLQLPNHELDQVPRAGRGTDLLLAVLLSLIGWLASARSGSPGHRIGLGCGGVCLGRRAESGYHDLTAHGASGAPAASRKVARWIFRHVHHSGVHEQLRDGDVDVKRAEGEVVADGWHQPLAEIARVIED